MSGVHTTLVTDAHGYTRESEPWIMDEHKSVYGKLIHYLAGGGMRTFGRTVSQEIVRRRQRRFLMLFTVMAVVWLALLVA